MTAHLGQCGLVSALKIKLEFHSKCFICSPTESARDGTSSSFLPVALFASEDVLPSPQINTLQSAGSSAPLVYMLNSFLFSCV